MDAEVPVRELMTKDVITVNIEDGVNKVQALLDENPIHHLVVLDKGEVVGIISKNDLLRLYQNGSSDRLSNMKAADLMTKNPVVVDPDDTIGLVSDIILANRFHSLPVVEDGILQGIITNHDLIKYSYK